MTIYVVKGPDGDSYYAGNRTALISKAYDAAAANVIANVPRLHGDTYEPEDVTEVLRMKNERLWDKLYKKLEEIGAIRRGYLID